MIKELTPQEVARKLADEGCFDALVRDFTCDDWVNKKVIGIYLNDTRFPFSTVLGRFGYCAIEIPDKYVPYPDNECPPLKCGDVIVNCDNKLLITGINEEILTKLHVFVNGDWKTNKKLFDLYTYLDGSPIGKREG